MSPFPSSIQRRLSLWLALQTLIGLSVLCVSVYVVTAWNFRQKAQEELDQQARLASHLLNERSQGGGALFLQHKLEDYFSSHGNVSVSIGRDGAQVFRSTPATSGEWVWADHRVAPQDSGPPFNVRIGIDTTQDARLLRRLGGTLALAVVLGTLLVSLTGALLVRHGLRPLRKLAERTARITPDAASAPIDPLEFAQELRPWIVQFNALMARVEQAYSQSKAFNADVAHELRTPLANLIASAEVELARPRSAQDMQLLLVSNLEEIRRLSGIVADMLFLSRADRGEFLRSRQPARLAEQACAVLEFHEALMEEAGLRGTVVGDATAAVDVPLVRRALSNLLGNAIRYAAKDSTIVVAIRPWGDGAEITVENEGPRIAPEALDRLFERFYRATSARDGSDQHHGLGLAIVDAIARMHGGKTFASSTAQVTRIGFTVSASPAEPPATS
ncbi:heavy metal sensor histidine kinase [Acidovorax sp. SUPP2825]|uniref:heavy metal sensor histidine kinase n=1 Tax=Acidovorax sp. SUPP2825 TaxID=2920879 RepID=UPI0023DE230A|nr:heavy metal sensor histidine kinase [Acidovorax sp. SUPP2825]GKS93570.1 heavy metal sensor histidine kinase [Acidovorax sp. SUPP2825]